MENDKKVTRRKIGYRRYKPSDDEASAFMARAQADRSSQTYHLTLAFLHGLLEGKSPHLDSAHMFGIAHAYDEVRLAWAAQPAQNESDLKVRAASLLQTPQAVDTNANLVSMLEAALIADIGRIAPREIPPIVRRKFRS